MIKILILQTGLTAKCLNSTVTIENAEELLLKFVKSHIGPRICPLAGNSVYMDRVFLSKFMPSFNNYLHYRIVDVSSIKELCKRWYPKEYKETPKKVFNHRALDDIRESIDELKYYRKSIFKK